MEILLAFVSIGSGPNLEKFTKRRLLAEEEDINSEPVDAFELKENITDD